MGTNHRGQNIEKISQKHIRQIYYSGTILILFLLASAITIPFNLFLNMEYKRKIDQLSSSILNQKEYYLKAIVCDKISDIEKQELLVEKESQLLGNMILGYIETLLSSSSSLDQLSDQLENYLSQNALSHFDYEIQWKGRVLTSLTTSNDNEYAINLEKIISPADQIRVLFKKDAFRNKVQDRAKDSIRSTVLPDNGYLWVNYILDYQGGDQYAIRLVHPNLPETEGSFLSTATTDNHGNLPYKEELEAVKTNGEAYIDYYFKKMNEDKISHKLSYVQLYEPFDWVIATGIYLDDLDLLVENEQAVMERSLKKIRWISLFIIITAILISIFVLWLFEKRIHWMITSFTETLNNAYSQIKEIAYHDSLSGLWNRRAMQDHLKAEESRAVREGKSFCLIMLDLDHFKEINDNYGHDSGDKVIQAISRILVENCRQEDKIGRWGGEEFLILAPTINLEQCRIMAEKIRGAIKSKAIKVDNNEIQVTMTLGIAQFTESKGLIDTLKESDDNLYRGKRQGRNCVVYTE